MLLSIRCINSVFQQNTHVFLIQFASFEYLQFNDLVTKLRREDIRLSGKPLLSV